MNENIDRPALTIEGAMMRGQDPLMPTLRERRKTLLIARLAKEYIIDFNLPKATARAGLEWAKTMYMERDPEFIATVQELVDMLDPEAVITRNELLMALKREAFTADKASERISALTNLAKLMGMELPTKTQLDINAPVINLTLTKADARKP